MTPQPNYYAVIPATLLYHKGLSPESKLLYARLTTIIDSDRRCEVEQEHLVVTDLEYSLGRLEQAGFLSFIRTSNGFQIALT